MFNLSERARTVFVLVETICEWRLGREEAVTAEGTPIRFGEDASSVEEIIACLKRIERSVKRWNKDGGRKGYLTFIARFFPSE